MSLCALQWSCLFFLFVKEPKNWFSLYDAIAENVSGRFWKPNVWEIKMYGWVPL